MMEKRFNNLNLQYPVNARNHKVTLTSGSQDKDFRTDIHRSDSYVRSNEQDHR